MTRFPAPVTLHYNFTVEGQALTHFTVFSCESVRTHTLVTPSLVLTGASITAGPRSTGIESNWKETGKRESLKPTTPGFNHRK